MIKFNPMRASLILFFLPLILASCEEKFPKEKITEYYFQREYVNYAWGFSHSGFTITPSGEVYTFDKTTPWVFADHGKMTFASLRKNIAASVKADTLINKSEIESYQRLLSASLSGKLSEPASRGADMGETICKVIVIDSTDPSGGYHEVILTEDGDIEQHNLAPEASVIADWLTQLKFH